LLLCPPECSVRGSTRVPLEYSWGTPPQARALVSARYCAAGLTAYLEYPDTLV
jgi:hypothetical protein